MLYGLRQSIHFLEILTLHDRVRRKDLFLKTQYLGKEISISSRPFLVFSSIKMKFRVIFRLFLINIGMSCWLFTSSRLKSSESTFKFVQTMTGLVSKSAFFVLRLVVLCAV